MMKIVLCFLLGGLTAEIIPENGMMLNYTQVFFRWDQIPHAESYTLSIHNSNGEATELISPHNSHLVTDFLDWNDLEMHFQLLCQRSCIFNTMCR